MTVHGAAKQPVRLQVAYGQAIDRLERVAPEEASIVRRYVSSLNEEAGSWRLRFRAATGGHEKGDGR